MSEPLFWYWNGWGVLFTVLLFLTFSSNYFIPDQLYSRVRSWISLTVFALFVLNVILCGWISGVLSYPIAMMGAAILRPFLLRDNQPS